MKLLRSKTEKYFLPYQIRWLRDSSPLRIMEKSRQVGITYVDSYDSVCKASDRHRPANVWISSRDELTAREYLNECKRWARILHLAARDYGEEVIEHEKHLTAYVLRFATERAIYCLSSSPDALVGKTGHIKLDEFAVHKQQRDLLRYGKPCTTWGGQVSVISTHRGHDSVFNEILTTIKEKGNPMGWSHHKVSLFDAVEQGLVGRPVRATSTRPLQGRAKRPR